MGLFQPGKNARWAVPKPCPAGASPSPPLPAHVIVQCPLPELVGRTPGAEDGEAAVCEGDALEAQAFVSGAGCGSSMPRLPTHSMDRCTARWTGRSSTAPCSRCAPAAQGVRGTK